MLTRPVITLYFIHLEYHLFVCLLIKCEQPSLTEIQCNLENTTSDPLNYAMGSPIITVLNLLNLSFSISSSSRYTLNRVQSS